MALAARRQGGLAVSAAADLPLAWHAAQVRRWHAHPQLAHLGDSVGAHSARACALARALWPDDGALLGWIVEHDAAEAVLGDLPGPARARFAALDAAWASAEAEVAAAAGLRLPGDPGLLARARLVDLADRWLFVRLHRPDLLIAPEWVALRREVLAQARMLGVGEAVGGWLR